MTTFWIILFLVISIGQIVFCWWLNKALFAIDARCEHLLKFITEVRQRAISANDSLRSEVYRQGLLQEDMQKRLIADHERYDHQLRITMKYLQLKGIVTDASEQPTNPPEAA